VEESNEHTLKLIKEGVYVIGLFQVEKGGVPYYLYLASQLKKLEELADIFKKKKGFRIGDYGVVLRSGPGEEPPIPVQRYMEKEYGYDHDSPLRFS